MLRATLNEQEIRRLINAPGTGDRLVEGISPLGAHDDRSLYFVNTQMTAEMRDSFAAREDCIVVVLTGSTVKDSLGGCIVLEADNPRAQLARVLQFIRDEQRVSPLVTRRSIASTANISPLAFVDGAVELAAEVVIEPFCVVGPDVKIGPRTIVRSGARIHSRVVVGENSAIGSNTVVGHQGYGFVRDAVGNKFRIPHLGGVLIGSNVEIGALVSIPSGTITPTVIEDYAKVDDLVHVAHNVRIGKGASVIAGVVIGGHAEIDEEAWVGMNASIRPGRRVGSHALVGMDASIQHDLADDSIARAPRPDVRIRKDDDHSAIGFTELR